MANRRQVETGRRRAFIVMAGAGRPSTPCGAESLLCHGRPCAGHPRLAVLKGAKAWVAGPGPAMTQGGRPCRTGSDRAAPWHDSNDLSHHAGLASHAHRPDFGLLAGRSSFSIRVSPRSCAPPPDRRKDPKRKAKCSSGSDLFVDGHDLGDVRVDVPDRQHAIAASRKTPYGKGLARV